MANSGDLQTLIDRLSKLHISERYIHITMLESKLTAKVEAADSEDLKTLMDSVSKLRISERYSGVMKRVEQSISKGIAVLEHDDDDPEYHWFVDCCKLLVDKEDEAIRIKNFIHQKIESLANLPIDCDLLLEKIRSDADQNLKLMPIDIRRFLPPKSILILRETKAASNRAVFLDSLKNKVLEFLEISMEFIAPNISAIVGSSIAAKLIGTAGGIAELAKMPSCDLQRLRLGVERVKNSLDFEKSFRIWLS